MPRHWSGARVPSPVINTVIGVRTLRPESLHRWPWALYEIMSAKTMVTKTKTTLRQETHNRSDLKHDLHCGYVELGDAVSVAPQHHRLQKVSLTTHSSIRVTLIGCPERLRPVAIRTVTTMSGCVADCHCRCASLQPLRACSSDHKSECSPVANALDNTSMKLLVRSASAQ